MCAVENLSLSSILYLSLMYLITTGGMLAERKFVVVKCSDRVDIARFRDKTRPPSFKIDVPVAGKPTDEDN